MRVIELIGFWSPESESLVRFDVPFDRSDQVLNDGPNQHWNSNVGLVHRLVLELIDRKVPGSTLTGDSGDQNPVIMLVLHQELRVSCTVGARVSLCHRRSRWCVTIVRSCRLAHPFWMVAQV